MRSITTFAFAAAALLALVGFVAPAAARDDGRGRRQCTDIRGYLDDPAPGGREVRAGPDPAAPVLGRIREPWTDGQATIAASFDIRASDAGWLLVENAGDDPVLTEGVDRPMYGGAGWIRGEGVRVGVQASQGFSEPRHASRIIVRTGSNQLDFLSAVVACDGNWVLGRWRTDLNREYRNYRYRPEAVVATDPVILQAWVTGICNIQETSCDMPSGDRPED
jgi:hypothetical protein